jgi:release factor glutamine methyltransferase
MTSVAVALAQARLALPVGEARLLLGHVLEKSVAWLMANDDAALTEEQRRCFDSLAARRIAGEPVAYLIGAREFYGREFSVSPAVLIPRPETELLVETALAAIDRRPHDASRRARVLDLGTGSGCVAITLALERPSVELVAVDISDQALSIGQETAKRLGACVEFHTGDWFSALAGQRFDVIVANPPYVASGDTHLQQGDLRFEPWCALASGADGLDALSHIVDHAPDFLHKDGELWLEHGYDQASAVRRLLGTRFSAVRSYPDLSDILRVSGGCRIG